MKTLEAKKNHHQTVTLASLADQLKVSTTTVSKALRGLPGIGPETTHKVKTLAEQVGYRPNVFAQGLKTANSTTVGILISSDIIQPWYAHLVSHLEEELSLHGYTVTLGLGKNQSDKERRCLETFRGGHVAGVIAGPIFRQRDLDPLWDFSRNGPPMVLFSCLDEMPVSYVGIDHIAGTKKAIDYLVSKGHRRIGYFCCPDPILRESSMTRREGFEEGLFANDLPLIGKDIIPGAPTAKDGFEIMLRLLSERKDDLPTAFFCHNDAAALGAIRAFQQRGLQIPKDISLIGYDDIEESAMSNPPLTTMGGIMDKLIKRLVEVLIEQIENPAATPTREKIIPQLIERESVC